MKNPYAPGFWCVFFALVLLSATYFYGVMLAHQIDKAMVFLDSACLVIGTLSIGVVAWASIQNQRVKRKQLEQGKTLVADLGHQSCPAPRRNRVRPLFLGQLLATWAYFPGSHG